MLIIANTNRLPEFGFERTGTNCSGREIWAKRVYNHENEEVYLVVNPLNYGNEHENEMELILGVDIERENIAKELADMGSGGYSREFTLPVDLIFDMMAAGVLRYVKDEKEAAA